MPSGLNVKATTTNEHLAAIELALESISASLQPLSLMAQDMAWLRAAIAPTGEALPAGAKSSVAWSVYRLMDAVAPAWPRPTGEPMQPALLTLLDALTALQTAYGDNSAALATQVDTIIDHIGFPTGDATTTVLGYLSAIARSSACACGPQAPTDEPPAGCEDDAQSIPSPLALSPAYPGRAFATWGLLPAGVEYGEWSSDLPVSAQLHLTTGNTVSAFGLSKRSGSFSANPTAGVVYPTNQWVALESLTNLAFSVPEDADLVVYLCIAPAATWLDCVSVPSASGTVTGGTLDGTPILAVPLVGLPGLATGSVLHGPPDYTYTISGCIAYANWHGYTVELLTDEAFPWARVVYKQSSDGGLVSHGLAVNEVFTIPAATDEVVIDTAYQAPFGTVPFQVRICPNLES